MSPLFGRICITPFLLTQVTRKLFRLFCYLCWASQADVSTCLNCLGRVSGICEVLQGWSHSLVTYWECSPQIKMLLFLGENRISVINGRFPDMLCLTIDFIFIGQFWGSLCDSVITEVIGLYLRYHSTIIERRLLPLYFTTPLLIREENGIMQLLVRPQDFEVPVRRWLVLEHSPCVNPKQPNHQMTAAILTWPTVWKIHSLF